MPTAAMPRTPAAAPLESLRLFNRFYTRKIGVLNSRLLDSPFSLTEARVLYELAHRPDITASVLCHDLGLDPGYLSRMLSRFAHQQLVKRIRSATDARQHHLQLTTKGRARFADLDRRSSAQAAELIGHLSPANEAQLITHLDAIRHLLAAPAENKSAVTLRPPKAGELGWVVSRHGALYAHEYGWNAEFEGLVARIVGEFVEHFDPRRERCWIAELDGHPVGCVFLVKQSDTIGKLRLLLVEPSARGRGVGAQLVSACVQFAREAGYRKIVLWTNSVLTAARHIYERAGFRLVAAEKHRSFGADLTGQTWERTLG